MQAASEKGFGEHWQTSLLAAPQTAQATGKLKEANTFWKHAASLKCGSFQQDLPRGAGRQGHQEENVMKEERCVEGRPELGGTILWLAQGPAVSAVRDDLILAKGTDRFDT